MFTAGKSSSAPSTAIPMAELALRARALRRGVRLDAFTVAWMAAEAVLAIGAGIAARSVLLTAFGADSLIELLSAVPPCSGACRSRPGAEMTPEWTQSKGERSRSRPVSDHPVRLRCAHIGGRPSIQG